MYDLVIIGSGPAGLSAAVYAKRAALDTVVLEQSPVSGGQVLTTYEVDNYLGLPGINGYDLGQQFREHADKLDCSFMETKVDSLEVGGNRNMQEAELNAAAKKDGSPTFIVRGDKGDFETRAIIIASGATHAKLNVPGEEELTGAGVSYCATCDGAFFRGKVVAVVGGGDVAVEDAIFLARGCEKVYLIHRRDQLRAAAILQQKAEVLPNVEILWDTVVEEICGTDSVERLSIRNVKTGEKTVLSLSGVFIAVGIQPNSQTFQSLVPCDKQGYIVAGEDCATKIPGIFAAGDVRTKKLRQIITAVSDGACAVAGVQHYLLNEV